MDTVKELTSHTVNVMVGRDESLAYTLHYVVTPEKLEEATSWVLTQPLLGLDYETSGLDAFKEKIATIQVGNPFADDPVAYVVDIRMFTAAQLQPFLDAVCSSDRKKMGQNLKFECRFTLASFGRNVWNLCDTQVTELILRAGLLPRAKGGDNEGGDRAAYGAASMGALTKRYLGIHISKDIDLRTSFYTTPPGQHNLRQLEYAAGDVIYTFYIYRKQQEEIAARVLGDILKIEYGLIPILASAEHAGMALNTDKWLDLWQEAVKGRMQAEDTLHKLLLGAGQLELLNYDSTNYKMLYPRTGQAINFSSPVQVKFAITTYCEKISWKIPLVTTDAALLALKRQYGQDWYEWKRKNNPDYSWSDVPEFLIPENDYCILTSTNSVVLRLARLKNLLPAELVAALLDYSKHDIRETTFGKDFITKHVHEDGRIHPEFHQCIVHTGRLSASPNSMNIPTDPRYRAAYEPRPGYSYVIADYSQIEPRLTAQESQDAVYLKTYKDNEDIYVNVCEATLGVRPDKTTEEGALLRQLFKIIVLAMAYRMGPPKLQRNLALSMERDILSGKVPYPDIEYVRSLHSQFLKTFSNLHNFQNACSNLANPFPENGKPRVIWDSYLNAPVTWITALCGRKRFFPMSATNTYTEAANSPIQGCSATITKAAIVIIQKAIHKHKLDSQLVNVVHDELVYECLNADAEIFAKILKDDMERAGQFYMPDVPVKAEYPENTNGIVPFWTKKGIKIDDAAATV